MTSQTRKTSNQEKALAAFVARKAEIDAMLARLQSLSENHFGAHPDKVDWSHVGDLGRYRELLRQITDIAFGEGECAD